MIRTNIAVFTFLSILGYSQVGINTEAPKATLDIKSHNDNRNQVLRFSTEPTDIDINKEYTLFAGVENDGGYDLRVIDINNMLDIELPPVNRFIAINSKPERFLGRNGNYPITLDTKVFNSSDRDFAHHPNEGAVELKESGYYSINAWASFESITSIEGDIVVSIARKKPSETGFSNVKRNVITRSNNIYEYKASSGIMKSFNFIEWFDAGDKLRINIVNPPLSAGMGTKPTIISTPKGSGIILHKLTHQ